MELEAAAAEAALEADVDEKLERDSESFESTSGPGCSKDD